MAAMEKNFRVDLETQQLKHARSTQEQEDRHLKQLAELQQKMNDSETKYLRDLEQLRQEMGRREQEHQDRIRAINYEHNNIFTALKRDHSDEIFALNEKHRQR